MRKGFKILLRIVGAIVLFLIILAVSIPLLFKDEITESIRRTIDQEIEGAFYFDKASVGILKSFPNLCLELTHPVLTGGAHPEGDSLFSAESVAVVLDLMSVIRGGEGMKIVGLQLTSPRISMYLDTADISNFQLIAVSDSVQSSDQQDSVTIQIDDYRISKGYFKYVDRTSGVTILVDEFDHKGDLRYSDDIIVLHSATDNGIVTLSSDGIKYLDDVHVQGTDDLEIDLANSVYKLLENRLSLNALEVDISGSVALTDESTDFDLVFSGERNSFKNLISLLPNMYTKDFDKIKATGNIALSGSLNGKLSDTGVPVYAVSLKVDNGAFQLPDSPFGFSATSFTSSLRNTAKGWEPVDIDVPILHFLLNGQPFDAHARIQNPTGSAVYKGAIKGVLDLADLAKAYPMPDIQTLEGMVDADVSFDIDAKRSESEQKVTGVLDLKRIHVQSGDENFTLPSGNIAFSSTLIEASMPTAIWNGSTASVNIKSQDYLGWLTQDQMMTLQGNAKLGTLDLNPYISAESETYDATTSDLDPSLNLIQFDGNVAIDTLIYESYIVTNGSASLHGTVPELRITQLRGDVNGTHFDAQGKFTDLHHYLNGTSPLKGTLNCDLDKIYVDRWIEDESSTTETTSSSSTYVALPRDIDLEVNFSAQQLQYDNIRVESPRGNIHLEDGILAIHDFKGRAMNGDVSFSGLYNTQDNLNPGFSMKYNLGNIKFAEAFAQIETFQTLAPIVKFIKGVFNSTLVVEGKLGENYMPDLKTLSASGFLETLNGTLQQTDVLDKLSQFLNLKQPLHWDIGSTKNWFEVKGGYVLLQEATKSIDGIEMSIGGKHQIQGDMDYLIKMNIPAERVTSNPVGALAKAGFDQLQSKAASYGVKIATIERFIVHVAMRGELSSPKFEILLFDGSGKGLKDVAKDQIEAVKEQLRDTVTAIADAKIEAVRDSLKSVIDIAVDSAKRVAEEKLREAGKEVIKDVTSRLDSTLRDSITNSVLDKIGDKALENLGQKETDKIKDALDKWDPFKKKKN